MTLRFCLLGTFLLVSTFSYAEPVDNIGHRRHQFKHGEPLPVEKPTPERFATDRTSEVELPQTIPTPAFTFLVFGDRTRGVPEGVAVLADAVREANLLGPDFVINVGDMVEGLRDTESWVRDMREYKSIMDELLCPWYPTPGNHDVCRRHFPKNSPPPRGEHESTYEQHFGPLRYSFEHKNCRFIVLLGDEGDPETGKKGTVEPSQRMSDEQFRWLQSALKQAADADHVFVFIHHPRWFKGRNYGTHWDPVHRLLVDAGNVSAVFAGQVHQMFYQAKDGIEYFVLPSTGGNQVGTFPRAGHVDAFHQVVVRKGRIDVAAVPVGSLIDPRETTALLRKELSLLVGQKPEATVRMVENEGGGVQKTVAFTLTNPGTGPVEVTVSRPATGESRALTPEACMLRIEPQGEATFSFDLHEPETPDTLRLNFDVVRFTPGSRIPVPWGLVELPIRSEPRP